MSHAISSSERGACRSQLGQMFQRIVQVLDRERREPDVLTRKRRYPRPVVGQGDIRRRRTNGRKVVAPDPSAEFEVFVVWALTGLPRDGVRFVEYLDSVRHLVVLVRVVLVIHRHPKDLTGLGQPYAVERFPHPTGAVDGGMG